MSPCVYVSSYMRMDICTYNVLLSTGHTQIHMWHECFLKKKQTCFLCTWTQTIVNGMGYTLWIQDVWLVIDISKGPLKKWGLNLGQPRPGGTKEHIGNISGSSMSHWAVTPQTDLIGKIPDSTATSWLPITNHSEDSTVISNQSAKGREEHPSGRILSVLSPTAGINRNFKYERGGLQTSLIAQVWVEHSWDH